MQKTWIQALENYFSAMFRAFCIKSIIIADFQALSWILTGKKSSKKILFLCNARNRSSFFRYTEKKIGVIVTPFVAQMVNPLFDTQ